MTNDFIIVTEWLKFSIDIKYHLIVCQSRERIQNLTKINWKTPKYLSTQRDKYMTKLIKWWTSWGF